MPPLPRSSLNVLQPTGTTSDMLLYDDRLDDTQYWFCFCSETGDHCQICREVLAGLDAVRIPYEQIGKVHVVNELMNYDLPATGGPGIYPYVLVGVICIVTPLVYGFTQRRKRERRGVG